MKFILPEGTPGGQRDAISADDDKITVSAGAGTGKTYVLSGRYARLVIDNKDISPSNILTLTYTDPAASEMKTRIISRVEAELNKEENKDCKDEKDRILSGLSESWISTIHSFAGRLIRESGLSLDIDPTANVITPQQEQEFWESIRNAVEFANLRDLARTYGNKKLIDAAKSLDEGKDKLDRTMTYAVNKWGGLKLSNFARAFAELHASSGNNWEKMLEWSENDIFIDKNGEARKKIQAILQKEWREVWDIFKNIELPKAKNPDGPGGRLNDLLNWQKLNSSDNIEALKFFYDSLIIDSEKKIKANQYEPFATLKSILGMRLGELRDTRSDILKEISLTFNEDISNEEVWLRKTLLKFCAVSWGMWDIMKSRRGLLSFSDMIIHARNAIKNEAVNKEFKHILVDEFQDTDPLQFNMIEALKEKTGASLFAVGDPKQSIYKFRHADLTLFAGMINNPDYRKITLEKSFRTRDSLLRKINNIFKSLWKDGLGQDKTMSELKFDALEAATADDPERNSVTMPDFKIILADHVSDIAETRKNLAEELALNISKWISEGRTIWDKDKKIIRPVKFSDFTVLSRTRGVYPNIEAAFEKFNIPSIRDRSEDFFTRGEIGDVVCLLRAASDFSDDFSVMGWLMSPFSEIPEDDVINKIFMKAGKKINLIELIKNNIPEAYSRLEYLSLIGTCEGSAGLLEIFDKDRRWLSCYREQDRLRVLRNFRLALSMARAFQQSGTSSLTACAEWLNRAVRRQLKIEEPKWHDEDENAVKLNAVHSSKGLEYPVTIIFDTQRQKKAETNPLRPSRDLGLVFSAIPDEIFTSDKKEKPRLVTWEKVISEQGELEEEQRLFYVAATRAQDSLIFCGMINPEDGEPYKNSWTKFLLDNLDE